MCVGVALQKTPLASPGAARVGYLSSFRREGTGFRGAEGLGLKWGRKVGSTGSSESLGFCLLKNHLDHHGAVRQHVSRSTLLQYHQPIDLPKILYFLKTFSMILVFFGIDLFRIFSSFLKFSDFI